MTRRSAVASAALAIPAAAYGAAIRLRNAWYDRPASVHRAVIPVISVGNLVLGGTGKTPLVAWIARRLGTMGLVPAVVSRGYGGHAGPGPLMVSTGGGPRVNAWACGDEPHLLARSLPGTIVIVGADRVEGARAAAGAGAAAVILDDGFQHRRLARDLDIVVLDARSPFDAGHLIPRGSLRERPEALRRAHLVVLTRVTEGGAATAAVDAVRAAGFAGPVVRAGHRTAGFHDASGSATVAPARALAFCGIGDPGLFRSDLEAAGVVTARFRTFRDHHAYGVAGWQALITEARAMGVPLITTDKDYSRLAAAVGSSLSTAPLVVLRIETVVWDEPVLVDALRTALAAAPAGAPR